ncbi:alpha-2,8-polysialyltransferase family protein [Marinobacter shengliensis]|uniref:alpha-2,8-polysialyltransferase family protein n=1 Tax=Marinobacter shengliensis TaxID=1389223 RepID=UPI001E4712E4|nr:alpha-2,8-polysialyltransferase family protein [Marinobacter shengliensis]MCD1630756.1 alpha-2,8-polysialyltransferase family protein [Marinobacter shengliensis]
MKDRNSSGGVLIVAQTPFQLYMAIVISKLSSAPVKLWIIDPALSGYLDACSKSNIWRSVNYAELNSEYVSDKRSLSNRIRRIMSFYAIRLRIKNFLRINHPSVVLVFSDNHEVTAAFVRLSKTLTRSRVVLGEEGSAAYFSYKRTRANPWKVVVRRALLLDNCYGYSIGWSPYIDSVLVSDADLVHPDYIHGRDVVELPPGPIPCEALEAARTVFSINVQGNSDGTRDILILGQPWSEMGKMSKESEFQMYKEIDKSSFSKRVIIKPHPFENPKKYEGLENVMLCDSSYFSVPAELLFDVFKPKLTISTFSSAAINYTLRFGGLSIFLLDELNVPQVQRFVVDKLLGLGLFRICRSMNDALETVEDVLEKEEKLTLMSHESLAEWKLCVKKIF